MSFSRKAKGIVVIEHMNRNMFLRLIRNNPGWENMIRRGSPGFSVYFGNVEFLIFRDDALHYLRAVPHDQTTQDVVMAFNSLMRSCRRELAAELDHWNMDRLTRDDNEGDR